MNFNNIMPVDRQNYEHAYSHLFDYAQKSIQMLKNMKDDNDILAVEIILREASTILQAARQHASELSEVGLTDHELDRMRLLITHVAAHSYTSLWNNINVTAEMNELKIVKEVILRAAEMRFGNADKVLSEFRYDTQHKSIV